MDRGERGAERKGGERRETWPPRPVFTRVYKELAAGHLRGFSHSDSSGRFTIGPCRNAVGPRASALFQVTGRGTFCVGLFLHFSASKPYYLTLLSRLTHQILYSSSHWALIILCQVLKPHKLTWKMFIDWQEKKTSKADINLILALYYS